VHDYINPNGKTPGSDGEDYKRAQTVDGVFKPTQLLSSKPTPSLSSSPEKQMTQHLLKTAHIKSFPSLHLTARALLTNRAESEEKMFLLQESQWAATGKNTSFS